MPRFVRRAARSGRRVGVALVVALLAGLTGVGATTPSVRAATGVSTSGYWLLGSDGGLFSYGPGAKFYGSTGAIPLNQPIVGMAPTPDSRGYWMVASDGGIFSFGDAAFYGSMGGKPLNQPIVAMAATRTGKGYWLVASDGGIFSFGDAAFFGSTGATKLNKPIVDIVPTPSGRGYWMAASDGGIFSFGDGGFFGSTGAIKLVKRIQSMATTPSGNGYWMVAGDGGVFSFGDAKFYGSAAETGSDKRDVDIAPSASGNGYYMTASNGAVYAYGDAQFFGAAADTKLSHGIIAMVAVNSGNPPVANPDTLALDENTAATADVLANDTDPDGGTLTLTAVSQPAHGSATFAIGTVGYRPAPNYSGPDSFTYTVTNNRGNTATGVVNVTVRHIDQLPKAVNDSFTVALGAPITLDVLANDSLADGPRAGGPIDIVTRPSSGTVAVSNDHLSIIYTPAKKGGPYTFVYRIVDADGDNSIASVAVTVTGPDLLPNAVDVSAPCGGGGCQTDVSKAPGFSWGDAGTVSLVGEANGAVQTADGTFTRNGNTISFAPANAIFTSASVGYQVTDRDNAGNPQVSNATVTFTNSAPTADNGGEPNPVPAANAMTWHLSAHDVDGDTLTFWRDGATGPDGVDPLQFVTIDPDGTLHYLGGAPAGSWTVTFHVDDGHGHASAPATFSFTTV